MLAAGQPDGRQQFAATFPFIEGCPVRQHGRNDVIHTCERGEEVIALEDESDAAPVASEDAAVQSRHVLAVADDRRSPRSRLPALGDPAGACQVRGLLSLHT